MNGFIKSLYQFTNKNILDLTKLAASADDKSNVAELIISFNDRVEDKEGIGEMLLARS